MREIEIVFTLPKDEKEISYFKGCGIGNLHAIRLRLNEITEALTQNSRNLGQNYKFSWHMTKPKQKAPHKPTK